MTLRRFAPRLTPPRWGVQCRLMRSFLAGIILLSITGSALAQATGFVTALGFQSNYRPDCWTPLLIHLDSTLSEPAEYQIQVHQQDLDNDTVVYARTVTLSPQGHQDYWAYFVPQPIGKEGDPGGLPNTRDALAQVLKVHLYDKNGRTLIATLPAGFSINNLDPKRLAGGSRARGKKLILCVLERDKPSWQDYFGAQGIMEDVEFLPVTTRDLPDSVLGYQAVDGIIWFDANAQDIAGFGGASLEALRQYVRMGGTLVVCQPPEEFGRIAPFADMLPVVLKDAKGDWAVEMRPKRELQPLIDIARSRKGAPVLVGDDWKLLQKTKAVWPMGHAQARPDAIVDEWITWKKSDATPPATQPTTGPTTGPTTSPADAGEDLLDPDIDPAAAGPTGVGPPAPGAPKPPPDEEWEKTPYIARRPYELGAVVWVAQDLGNGSLIAAPHPNRKLRNTLVRSEGWPHVWDRVFGWSNDTYLKRELNPLGGTVSQQNDKILNQYNEGVVVDLGGSLLKGMEHGARSAAYIFLAVMFFIGYWVVAGPGSFFFLAARKRRGLSWMVFALAALLATALTVGVVKLVLRGEPEVRHISIVRMTPTDPAADGTPRFATVVNSRLGLYIPRDGDQRVEVTDTTAGRPSVLIPFAVHPQHVGQNSGFTNTAKYVVHTDQFLSGQPVRVDFPYRSTLKKLQAGWTGNVPNGIEGHPALSPARTVKDATGKAVGWTGTIGGFLTNKTGRHLTEVYFAFSYNGVDRLLFIPVWPNGATLDLDVEYNQKAEQFDPNRDVTRNKPLKAFIDSPNGWRELWYKRPREGSSMAFEEKRYSDEDDKFAQSFPLMALFDRVGPDVGKQPKWDRADLLRRGGRDIDASQLVAAGRLVILAQAEGSPVPLPLSVEGEPIKGEGVTLYEIALPLDRSALPDDRAKPTSRPATQPASQPATAAPPQTAAGDVKTMRVDG